MGEQALGDDYLGVRVEGGFSLAQSRVDARELYHLHLAVRAFFHGDFGHGVEYSLACAIAFAVVLLDIFYFCVLADKEAVDAVVLGLFTAAVVYAAARDYQHIRALADIKIVIYLVVYSGLGDDNWDMHLFALCERLYIYVYARVSFFGLYCYIFARLSRDALTVLSDVERARRH